MWWTGGSVCPRGGLRSPTGLFLSCLRHAEGRRPVRAAGVDLGLLQLGAVVPWCEKRRRDFHTKARRHQGGRRVESGETLICRLLALLAPAAGARRVWCGGPVVPCVRFADCGHRPANFFHASGMLRGGAPCERRALISVSCSLVPWCLGVRNGGGMFTQRHQDTKGEEGGRGGRSSAVCWRFLRPLPGRVACDVVDRWFRVSALRTAVTDRLISFMPPAC